MLCLPSSQLAFGASDTASHKYQWHQISLPKFDNQLCTSWRWRGFQLSDIQRLHEMARLFHPKPFEPFRAKGFSLSLAPDCEHPQHTAPLREPQRELSWGIMAQSTLSSWKTWRLSNQKQTKIQLAYSWSLFQGVTATTHMWFVQKHMSPESETNASQHAKGRWSQWHA